MLIYLKTSINNINIFCKNWKAFFFVNLKIMIVAFA